MLHVDGQTCDCAVQQPLPYGTPLQVLFFQWDNNGKEMRDLKAENKNTNSLCTEVASDSEQYLQRFHEYVGSCVGWTRLS